MSTQTKPLTPARATWSDYIATGMAHELRVGVDSRGFLWLEISQVDGDESHAVSLTPEAAKELATVLQLAARQVKP